MKANKYVAFPLIQLDDRKWPGRRITSPPRWCSVDLRDGNQSLEVPMTVEKKTEMFAALVDCGFKEIEVGFPAASPTEFQFVRKLIEENLIPDDVTIQVLVQAREELIQKTITSLKGAKRIIIHLYNSTSPAQRKIVFGMEKPEVLALAVSGTRTVKKCSRQLKGTEVLFEYSPESFSATEVEFALEVCEAVMDEWGATPEHPMILNLPDTVEVAMPNVYADQIEWFCRNMTRRSSAVISVHTHNDRGTGVAATEFGILAGAERVEGTLFGNGERTGNLDIVTVALNMLTQGIDPGLDFSDIPSLRKMYEQCTGMTVHDRQPYSGDLVFTAFSGSHQDAINKGFHAREKAADTEKWDIPYLIIDPQDIGRTYHEVVRINGQSGKGGIAHILERKFGIHMPKDMVREFGSIAGTQIDKLGQEATAEVLHEMFQREYIQREGSRYELESFSSNDHEGICKCSAMILLDQKRLYIKGEGNGPIDAFIHAMHNAGVADVYVLGQAENALGEGSAASAIAYIQLQFPDGIVRWGAGVGTSITLASIRAVVSALNREPA